MRGHRTPPTEIVLPAQTPRRWPGKSGVAWRTARAGVPVPPTPQRIEVLQGQTQGVHAGVTDRALRVAAVQSQLLAQSGEMADLFLVEAGQTMKEGRG